MSRGLTHKTQDNVSSDEEVDTTEPIPDVTLSQDPTNPWMMKRSDKSNVDIDFEFGYKKYVEGRMFKRKLESDDSDDDDDGNNTGVGLQSVKEGIEKINDKGEVSIEQNDEQIFNIINEPAVSKNINKSKVTKSKKPKANKLTATSNWKVDSVQNKASNDGDAKPSEKISTVFDSFENTIAEKVEKKLKKIRKNIENLEKKSKTSYDNDEPKVKEDFDNLEYLKLRNQKVKAIIDEELIETGSKSIEEPQNNVKSLSKVLNTQTTVQNTSDSNIDPSRFIEVKPKYLNTTLPRGENEFDQLDDDEQVVPKVNIEEVFEEDDVVASFRQEKEDEMNKDKPQDIDLSLPGWGSWGGKGVKAPKRKKNRFILKAPIKVPRRDENKGDIIIKEYKDPKLAAHKVADVPFPFTSVKEYEASIRAPLGNTFIPEKAHKKLIRPSVITKAGTIIEAMDEEELLVPKNRNFRNESVITLLGQK